MPSDYIDFVKYILEFKWKKFKKRFYCWLLKKYFIEIN